MRNTRTALLAYNAVSVEARIMSADPHQLVSMLYEGALLSIAKGRQAMLERKIESKGESISKAIAIVGEGLNASLDKNVGGELAQNLSSLYDYMVLRLIAANLNNDTAALDEVTHLLTELKEAWDSIRSQVVRDAQRNEQDAGIQGRRTHP